MAKLYHKSSVMGMLVTKYKSKGYPVRQAEIKAINEIHRRRRK